MQSPLPVLALLSNAFIWGLAWWPFRVMHGAGLHPLWATAVMYCGVLALLLALTLLLPKARAFAASRSMSASGSSSQVKESPVRRLWPLMGAPSGPSISTVNWNSNT